MKQNVAVSESIPTKEYAEFLEVLKSRVATSRYQAARAVNKELILLYHHIGTEILKRQGNMVGALRSLTNSVRI